MGVLWPTFRQDRLENSFNVQLQKSRGRLESMTWPALGKRNSSFHAYLGKGGVRWELWVKTKNCVWQYHSREDTLVVTWAKRRVAESKFPLLNLKRIRLWNRFVLRNMEAFSFSSCKKKKKRGCLVHFFFFVLCRTLRFMLSLFHFFLSKSS
jgi:hypothetical protein